MKAKYDRQLSWEQRQWYDLDIGVSICVEYSPFYGNLVVVIRDNETEWLANNGIESLPDKFSFAMEWVKPISESHWQNVMKEPIVEFVDNA